MSFNVRVEYEKIPIRHIAVECPKCKRWFNGWDIADDRFYYKHEIYYTEFTCPLCDKEFGGIQHGYKPNIEETAWPMVYKDCIHKKRNYYLGVNDILRLARGLSNEP